MFQSSYEKLGDEAEASTTHVDGVVVGRPYYPPLSGSPIAVIGRQFCAPYAVDLVIVRKVMSMTDGNFSVRDVNGNTMFKMKAQFGSFRGRRVLVDASGSPIVSMQKKLLSTRDRWKVFKGDSKAPEDLIFSAKRSSLFQYKTKLNVFLASNTTEAFSDFKVKGSWFERSCKIYNGNADTLIAQMRMKHTASSLLIGKDTFMVTVCPNVDYAFVAALIVILDAINRDSVN
ncbi:hypothetical protein Sjap_001549 [Stephania japonica]|uniref:Uncharacterized protein n=1 Tax=Stephania japonica TaxID=461633 RepID=A0AAP0KLX1_9MAGN